MNQDKKPDALRFADDLDSTSPQCQTWQVSAEPRRLHAESELHQQELASYRFTVENREARIAELEARVQELEEQTAHIADLVELADYATKKLEASQARVPLNPHQVREIIKKLNAEHGDKWNHGDFAKEVELFHGITQEKQG